MSDFKVHQLQLGLSRDMSPSWRDGNISYLNARDREVWHLKVLADCEEYHRKNPNYRGTAPRVSV